MEIRGDLLNRSAGYCSICIAIYMSCLMLLKKITPSFEFNSGQQTFIGIRHVESIVLGAGEDMDCANLSVNM